MQVRLKKDWCGMPAGALPTMAPRRAKLIIEQGIAEAFPPVADKPPAIAEKPQTAPAKAITQAANKAMRPEQVRTK